MDAEWRYHAACHGMWELFDTAADAPESVFAREAKRVCAGCPVRQPCLDDAVETRDVDGVRGGLTGPERDRIVRSRPEIPHRTPVGIATLVPEVGLRDRIADGMLRGMPPSSARDRLRWFCARFDTRLTGAPPRLPARGAV